MFSLACFVIKRKSAPANHTASRCIEDQNSGISVCVGKQKWHACDLDDACLSPSNVFMVFGIVAAVAEWLVRGFAAATKRNSIANFIRPALHRLDWNAASHPDWTAHAHLGIFNQYDRMLKRGLNWFSSFLVADDQTARWAVCGLLDSDSPGF